MTRDGALPRGALPRALRALTAAAALVGIGATDAMAQASANDEPHFTVDRFEVHGAHVLPQGTIDRVLAPFAGANRTFADLEQAVAALKEAYLHDGFSSVAIVLPEQAVQNGVIRIDVTEARLGKVLVAGNKFFDNENIIHSLPGLVPGQIPNMSDVAAEVRMADDNPSKQIQVTMRQGKAPEETDAIVRVTDENPMQYAAVIDNTGTSPTGRVRLGFALHDANVFNLDHVLSAQVQTSAEYPEHVAIFGANYMIPMYSIGQTLDFSLGYSNVDSGLVTTTAGSYGISGSGTTLSARLTQYLARSQSVDQRLFEELDYRAYTNQVTLANQGASLVPNVTVHPLDLGYAINFKDKDLILDAGVTYVHNIPGGPRGTTEDFQQPGGRIEANASYQMLRYQATLAWLFARDWSLRLAVNGQQSRDALIAPEQFGAGGIDSVRGFEEREAVNDRGNRESVELETPDQIKRWFGDAWQLRGVVFYDAAQLERNHALPGEIGRASIASAGFGLRMTYENKLSVRLDLAEVLDGAGLRPNHSDMLHASAVWAF